VGELHIISQFAQVRRRRIRCRRGTHDNNKHQHRAAGLGSCGRAPYHIAVRSSPARANGSTAAPSARRTTASARLDIEGDWASVGLVGRLAWWFLRPNATRMVFFLFQSTQHGAAGAGGRPAPASRSPPPPVRALGSRPPADPARSAPPAAVGICRAAAHLRPPPTAASALGTRRPPAVPARCEACAAAAGACRPPRPRPPCSAPGIFVSWLRHLPWRWVDKGAARGSINAWRSAHSPSLG